MFQIRDDDVMGMKISGLKKYLERSFHMIFKKNGTNEEK